MNRSSKIIGISVGLGLIVAVSAVSVASAAPPPGAGGLTQRIETVVTTIPPMQHTTVEAQCDSDEILTGGGYVIASIGPDDKVFANTPAADNTWHVEFFNGTVFEIDVSVSAVCLGHPGAH